MLSGVLDVIQELQSVREGIPELSYDISAKNYDEKYEPVTGFETYNEYGDYIYSRPNQEDAARFEIKIADYEMASFSSQLFAIEKREWEETP